MRAIWLLLATFIGVTVGGPLSPSLAIQKLFARNVPSTRNSVIEQGILDALEELRDVILNGADDIPPLDPLHIDELTVGDDIIPFPGAEVEVKDATVTNLATFVVDSLSVNRVSTFPIMRYRLQLEGHIPVLDAEANYYNLDLHAMGAHIFGTGEAKIRVIKPKLKINILARIRAVGGIYVTLEDTVIQVDLDAFEPNIRGLFHHEGASDFVNVFLADVVPVLIKTYEAEITAAISKEVQTIANDILEDFDLTDLLG